MAEQQAKPKKPLVVIEDATLAAMAASLAYTREFPFLKALSAVQTGGKPKCGKCGRARAQQVSVFNAAKAAIAGLGSERRRRLKELLNTEKIRIRYTQNGKVITLTT